MPDIKLGEWESIKTGLRAYCMKVDSEHVWYQLEKNRHVFPVSRHLWLATMKLPDAPQHAHRCLI